MAIAFDAAGSTIGDAYVQNTFSWSHTCGAGSDRLLLVGVAVDQPTNVITGVTVGGTSILANLAKFQAFGSTASVALYWMLNPPASTPLTITVTLSAFRTANGQSVSYTGAQQSGVPDATNGTGTTGANLLIPTTVVTANAWVTMFGFAQGSTNPILAGTGTTLRQIGTNTGAAYARVGIGDSNGPQAAGSYSMTMSQAVAAGIWPGATIAFAPSAGLTPANGTLAQTLGTLTSAATGTVAIASTATPTLGALTSTAAGTVVWPPLSGNVAQTLGTLTSTGTATLALQGTLAGTLGALTISSTASAPVAGQASLAATLGVLTGTADGTVEDFVPGSATHIGSMRQTLGDLALAAAMAVRVVPPELVAATLQARRQLTTTLAVQPAITTTVAR